MIERIMLMRHGATPGNVESRYIGAGTNEGLSVSSEVLLRTHCCEQYEGTVFASDLLRTQQTAEIMFPHAHVVSCEELREMHFGTFEGKNWRDLAEDTSYRRWVEGGCVESCPEGESREEFIQRSLDGFIQCLKMLEQNNERLGVFVIHGGTIMSLLSSLHEPVHDYFSWKTKPASAWCANWNGVHLRDAREVSLPEIDTTVRLYRA